MGGLYRVPRRRIWKSEAVFTVSDSAIGERRGSVPAARLFRRIWQAFGRTGSRLVGAGCSDRLEVLLLWRRLPRVPLGQNRQTHDSWCWTRRASLGRQDQRCNTGSRPIANEYRLDTHVAGIRCECCVRLGSAAGYTPRAFACFLQTGYAFALESKLTNRARERLLRRRRIRRLSRARYCQQENCNAR